MEDKIIIELLHAFDKDIVKNDVSAEAYERGDSMYRVVIEKIV